MPAFLTNNTSQCCCPEMRCCAPETVVATMSGWDGTNIPQWVGRNWYAVHPLQKGYVDITILPLPIAYETGTIGCFNYYATEWDGDKNVIRPDSLYLSDVGTVWPSIAFPQHQPFTHEPGYFACPPGEDGQYYASGFAPADPDPRCVLYNDFCENPGAGVGSIVYGPSTGMGSQRTFLNDYNEPYICHRLTGDMRPEFIATVERTDEATDDDIDARIVFDVFCRRNWVIDDVTCGGAIIQSLSCAVSDDPPENPPEGSWYCIDYRCGPRLPAYADGGDICTQYRCTAHEGTVWPHLIAIPPEENFTANLRLILVPDKLYSNTEYGYQAAKSQKPISWRVGAVKILNKGSGYEVGQSFKVDFDPFWMSTLSGGEIMLTFPDTDGACLNFPITWRDKYGAGPEITNGVKRYYQALRVMAVDEDGGIEELEIVPWFRDPEFVPGACFVPVSANNRTPNYPSYARVICHPNSVDIGGTGYSINDAIHFTPVSPGVEIYANAIARVVDVDDDGAVLDWEINGSDIWRYGFGMGNMYCYLMTPDERGAYRWADKRDLCYLHWFGTGVPVRQVSQYVVAQGVISWANTGGLTQLMITVKRVPCRTTISVVVGPYKYESRSFEVSADSEEASQTAKLLKKYRPYPKCMGGGAQITPVIGEDGGNESAIGGPLVGGQVRSGGDYYAFVDKRHVAPILPSAVPDIGDGSGAVINQFALVEVLGFPRPDYANGELHEPAADRFSYWRVTDATIAAGGSGYEIGQEFEVKPEGGRQYANAWRTTGGDDPDANPNGAWYEGQNLNEDGHVPLELVINGTSVIQEDFEFRPGTCRILITDVDENGAITELQVLHGGLMYRTVWADGVRHPDVSVYTGSDTGTGARATVVVDTDKESETFGEVTSCAIVQIPIGEAQDPLHSTPGNPVAIPLGGRDYANPPSGFMWEMENIEGGGQFGVAAASFLSYIQWHNWVYDPYHPENSTHDLIEGTLPPFYRRANHCTLDECYHSLLNRSYPMFRIWNGLALNRSPITSGLGDPSNTDDLVDATRLDCFSDAPVMNTYAPLPAGGRFAAGKPKGPYGLFRVKNKISAVYLDPPEGVECDPAQNIDLWLQRIIDQPGYNGPPTASVGDYVVVEHGYSISLAATIPVHPNCPDRDDGRTSP